MSVKINDVEYTGLPGLLIGVPIAVITLFFTSTVLIWVALLFLSPLIIIGLLIWWLS